MLCFMRETHHNKAHTSNANCHKGLFCHVIRAAPQKKSRTSIEMMPREHGAQLKKCCACCKSYRIIFQKSRCDGRYKTSPIAPSAQWPALMQVVTWFKRSCPCNVNWALMCERQWKQVVECRWHMMHNVSHRSSLKNNRQTICWDVKSKANSPHPGRSMTCVNVEMVTSIQGPLNHIQKHPWHGPLLRLSCQEIDKTYMTCATVADIINGYGDIHCNIQTHLLATRNRACERSPVGTGETGVKTSAPSWH